MGGHRKIPLDPLSKICAVPTHQHPVLPCGPALSPHPGPAAAASLGPHLRACPVSPYSFLENWRSSVKLRVRPCSFIPETAMAPLLVQSRSQRSPVTVPQISVTWGSSPWPLSQTWAPGIAVLTCGLASPADLGTRQAPSCHAGPVPPPDPASLFSTMALT